jgi:ATP-dependent Clp protease protease subunit
VIAALRTGAAARRSRIKIMRRIYLFGDICNERAEKFIAQLHELFDESDDPVTIFINSCGGSVTDALAIYDVLRNAPCNIYTVGLGKVHSAAVTVMLAAPRENRASYANTEFMSHDISWKSDGPRAYLKDRVDQLERTVSQLLRVYTADTNLSADEARRLFFTDLADHYFAPEEALAMGFVSRIISRDNERHASGQRAEVPLMEPLTAQQDKEVGVVNSSQNAWGDE